MKKLKRLKSFCICVTLLFSMALQNNYAVHAIDNKLDRVSVDKSIKCLDVDTDLTYVSNSMKGRRLRNAKTATTIYFKGFEITSECSSATPTAMPIQNLTHYLTKNSIQHPTDISIIEITNDDIPKGIVELLNQEPYIQNSSTLQELCYCY